MLVVVVITFSDLLQNFMQIYEVTKKTWANLIYRLILQKKNKSTKSMNLFRFALPKNSIDTDTT